MMIKNSDKEDRYKDMKATFVTFDFGYKNLLKTERPTSENIISGMRTRIS